MRWRFCTLRAAFPVPGHATGPRVVLTRPLESCEITTLGIASRVPMERREWPILHIGYKAVLHRIEPAVVDVMLKVPLVLNEVLPVSALPNAPLSPSTTALGQRFAFRNGFGEPNLDVTPPDREIEIIVRQGPHGVYVVG